MDNKRIARELIGLAKKLRAKPEVDFKSFAERIDDMVEQIDDHLNANDGNYERATLSQIDKATRRLMDAKRILKDIDAYDEDPLGVVNRSF